MAKRDYYEVLGVEKSADQEAIKKAYKQVEKVSFDNAFYRKDIGGRALKAKEGIRCRKQMRG